MAKNRPAFWRHPVRAVSPPPPPALYKVPIDSHSPIAYTVDILQDSPGCAGAGVVGVWSRTTRNICLPTWAGSRIRRRRRRSPPVGSRGTGTGRPRGRRGSSPCAPSRWRTIRVTFPRRRSGRRSPETGRRIGTGRLRRSGGVRGFFLREAFPAFADSPGVATAFACCCAERRGRRSLPGWLRIRRWVDAGFRRLLPGRRDAGPYSWHCGCGWLGRACIPVSDSAKPQPRYPMNKSNKPSALPLAHPASPKTTTRRGICPGQDHHTPIVQKEGAAPCIHPLLLSGPATRWGCF